MSEISHSELETEQYSIVNNRVLVVDDDPDVLQTYRDILDSTTFSLDDFSFIELEGGDPANEPVEFEVDSVNQGRMAVERIRESMETANPYAVVFLDMRMPPGIDGLETARRIRALDDDVYLVFVTAYSDHSVDEMQDVLHKNTLLLHKPFHRDVVLQMARTLCISWAREQCLTLARQRLSHLSQQMADQITHDSLTGLYNRYYLDRQIEIEIRRARREQQPLGVLMLDIDWFKLYNDQHGHLIGDRALQQIAAAMMRVVRRPADFVARYGGEEFCVVLPNTDLAGVERVGELICEAVNQLALVFEDDTDAATPHLTISVGGVSRIPLPADRDTALVDEADQRLYLAKNSGKNRVIV